MAQRAVCLYQGQQIGIESIYTVIDGKQINIQSKVEDLREKSRRDELFCPCGCGSVLTLVASDRGLREQHFRLKNSGEEKECHALIEGKTSIDSKVVLKCWLDDRLKASDIKTRVPIYAVGDTSRKYEFSFLSREKNFAINYCCSRINLSDEKFEILDQNRKDIQLISIVDVMNGGCNGQYPENLMKVQQRQDFCLLLDVENPAYNKAKMSTVFYAQDAKGLWREQQVFVGTLSDYSLSPEGELLYKDKVVAETVQKRKKSFEKSVLKMKEEMEQEKFRKEQEAIRKAEEESQLEEERRQKAVEAEQVIERMIEQERARRLELQKEAERKAKEFKETLPQLLISQESIVRDQQGNRWIQCEICGHIGMESDFTMYGGIKHINLGVCKKCFPKTTEELNKLLKKIS